MLCSVWLEVHCHMFIVMGCGSSPKVPAQSDTCLHQRERKLCRGLTSSDRIQGPLNIARRVKQHHGCKPTPADPVASTLAIFKQKNWEFTAFRVFGCPLFMPKSSIQFQEVLGFKIQRLSCQQRFNHTLPHSSLSLIRETLCTYLVSSRNL